MPRILADRYQIDEAVLEGDQATIYAAVDFHLRRPVSIRVLNPESAADPEAAQRFLDHARLSASYAHPNIIATYDVGTDDGSPYAVTELVEGEKLSSLMRNSAPLHPDRIRMLGAQLASALDYVQRHDSAEYGVDPERVLVTWGDRVKVLDFHEKAARTGKRNTGFSVSIDGHLSAAGQVTDEERTGVQALGVLLYQMATGRDPFRRDPGVLHAADATHVVRPSLLNSTISPAMERLILGALETGPDRRYRRISELILALQAHDAPAAGMPLPSEATTPSRRVEPEVVDVRQHRDTGWAAVLIPTAVLAAILVSAVFAATTVRPQLALPTVAGIIFGGGPSVTRDDLAAQNQAAELQRAIASVRANTQKVSSILGVVRDKLAAEMAVVDGMRSLVDDMKRQASSSGPNPGLVASLAAKRQSFELSYGSFQAARSAFDSAANDAASNLAPMNEDVGRAQAAANQLSRTLARRQEPISVQPSPGDEKGAISEFNSATQGAQSELTSMRKAESDLVAVADSLRQQADDAAALRVSQAPTAAMPTPGPAPYARSGTTPGPTPIPTPTATPAPSPTPTQQPAPRPTAPAAPASARTYPYAGVFAPLARQIGNVVGAAIEKEHSDASGDVYQKTTGGMLVWKKSANRAYFTDGFMTWVVGPNGLQSRPNGQLFDWEKTPTPSRQQ